MRDGLTAYDDGYDSYDDMSRHMNRLCLCGHRSCGHWESGCDNFRLAPLTTEVLVSGYVKTRDEMNRESRAGHLGCLRDTAIEYADMLVEFLATGNVGAS